MARGHDVLAVFTQPDRPRGRGQQLAWSPVKEAAVRHNLEIYQPERIRKPENVELLRSLSLDAIVVVGYGQIIPQNIIDIPQLGIVNVHASLLPKYRGAAPIQWAIANGETVTGITTMQINAGLDTGDMLLKWETPIGPEETSIDLALRMAPAGADLLIETLDGLGSAAVKPIPQNNSEATLAPILKKEDGLIDWTWPAAKIHARCRGFQPWPGTYTSFRNQLLQIRKCAVAVDIGLAPGQLRPEKNRLLVGCGESTSLELLELQLPGKKRMPAGAFMNGYRPQAQEQLG